MGRRETTGIKKTKSSFGVFVPDPNDKGHYSNPYCSYGLCHAHVATNNASEIFAAIEAAKTALAINDNHGFLYAEILPMSSVQLCPTVLQPYVMRMFPMLLCGVSFMLSSILFCLGVWKLLGSGYREFKMQKQINWRIVLTTAPSPTT